MQVSKLIKLYNLNICILLYVNYLFKKLSFFVLFFKECNLLKFHQNTVLVRVQLQKQKNKEYLYNIVTGI